MKEEILDMYFNKQVKPIEWYLLILGGTRITDKDNFEEINKKD